MNEWEDVHGIVIQLPLPYDLHPDFHEILDTINPQKDIDCLTSVNYNNMIKYDLNDSLKSIEENMYPCTAISIDQMLNQYQIEVENKNVVILGSSYLVGTPIQTLFTNKKGIVTILNNNNLNFKNIIKNADILVSCTGKEIILQNEDIKKDLVLLDVGIVCTEGKKEIRGDIDKTAIMENLKYYTPVPGGIGPLTVANMITNLYKSFLKLEKINHKFKFNK